MSGKTEKTDGGKTGARRWLLLQTIAVFIALLAGVYLVAGEWKGTLIIALAANLFLGIMYALTGKLLIKSMDS